MKNDKSERYLTELSPFKTFCIIKKHCENHFSSRIDSEIVKGPVNY